MSIFRKSNKKSSSRRQIDIKGVRDGILLLPHNEYRTVLEASSINFELKSEDEQDVLIDIFESFLNSLPCPIQIIVRVRELDMSKYLADLQTRSAGEDEAVYRTQIENYSSFVQSLVTDNKILSRRFYIVIPFSAKGSEFEAVKEQLTLLNDMVTKGLLRLGVHTRQLSNLEILDLFHSFYNPAQAKSQPITEGVVRLLNSTYVRGERS